MRGPVPPRGDSADSAGRACRASRDSAAHHTDSSSDLFGNRHLRGVSGTSYSAARTRSSRCRTAGLYAAEFDAVLATGPADTADFLRRVHDDPDLSQLSEVARYLPTTGAPADWKPVVFAKHFWSGQDSPAILPAGRSSSTAIRWVKRPTPRSTAAFSPDRPPVR